jgi:hypothetical protein
VGIDATGAHQDLIGKVVLYHIFVTDGKRFPEAKAKTSFLGLPQNWKKEEKRGY